MGELDIATVPQLEATIHELVESGFDHVVLDLANVEDGLRLQVRPGPPAVQKIFTLSGTAELSLPKHVRHACGLLIAGLARCGSERHRHAADGCGQAVLGTGTAWCPSSPTR